MNPDTSNKAFPSIGHISQSAITTLGVIRWAQDAGLGHRGLVARDYLSRGMLTDCCCRLSGVGMPHNGQAEQVPGQCAGQPRRGSTGGAHWWSCPRAAHRRPAPHSCSPAPKRALLHLCIICCQIAPHEWHDELCAAQIPLSASVSSAQVGTRKPPLQQSTACPVAAWHTLSSWRRAEGLALADTDLHSRCCSNDCPRMTWRYMAASTETVRAKMRVCPSLTW